MRRIFPFRPWVRRAGLSIVVVASMATAAVLLTLLLVPSARYGWVSEPFVWVYLGTLLAGGLKIALGTRRPVVELDESGLILRPLHQFRQQRVAWSEVTGTEQMLGGDRMIVYFEGKRGMRFVALNLNLVRGRRDLLEQLDRTLEERGFREKIADRSRYLSLGNSERGS